MVYKPKTSNSPPRKRIVVDIFAYGGAIGQGPYARITSPASSGSTVTVIGGTGKWYIANMISGGTGTSVPWTGAAS